MRKALVETVTGLVINVIEIEDESTWSLPVGHTLMDPEGSVGPGYTWDGSEFVPPEVIPVTEGVPISAPPSGSFRVTNLYVDPTRKLQVEYDDKPV